MQTVTTIGLDIAKSAFQDSRHRNHPMPKDGERPRLPSDFVPQTDDEKRPIYWF